MAVFTGPMTKLQAVNICLSSLGEPEIDTLDDAGLDAEAAANLIEETSAAIQQTGWHWNREIHTISPDEDGFLLVPSNALHIDTTRMSADIDLVQRGPKLFDRENNTYVFSTPVEVELIACLPWDDLPAAARHAIAYVSADVLQQRLLTSDALGKVLAIRAKDAMAVLRRDEIMTSDANMARDSWSVARGLRRRGRY